MGITVFRYNQYSLLYTSGHDKNPNIFIIIRCFSLALWSTGTPDEADHQYIEIVSQEARQCQAQLLPKFNVALWAKIFESIFILRQQSNYVKTGRLLRKLLGAFQ